MHHSCFAALCPDPADVANGRVTFTGNSAGDTATYTCNSSFELIGNASVTCTQVDDFVAYFPTAPVCRRKYYMIISSRCLYYHTHCLTSHLLLLCSPVS